MVEDVVSGALLKINMVVDVDGKEAPVVVTPVSRGVVKVSVAGNDFMVSVTESK